MSTDHAPRVVHVFPNSARLSCGPCNAIMAFMDCQLRQGLDVRALSPADPHIPAARRQPIEHLPIREFDLERDDFCALALELAENRRTVFHFHGVEPWLDALGRALKKNSTPQVFTSHGQLHFNGGWHALKKFTFLNFFSGFVRRMDGLHFLTRREARRAKFILPFAAQKIFVQPNLVQLPDEAGIVPAERAALGIPAGTFVFAYLGRLDVNTKGLDFLVPAFAEISRGADSRLVMVGPDFNGGREFLETLAKKLGCAEKIIFTGPQNGAVKWGFLKMADAFVSPSRWEACSIAQAEAIGLGLPTIVSTEINLAPEMTERGVALAAALDTGALAAEMRRLMADAALRRSLADAGRKWVDAEFSFASAGPRFTEFYRSVLADASR